MKTESQIYVNAEEIMADWSVCRATAYSMIRQLNEALLQAHPTAIVIPGKVNRIWYDTCCLRKGGNEHA